MNIALLGYGKMGKVIEKIALERGHHIVLKSNHKNSQLDLDNVDVAIEFSTPESAVDNITQCILSNTPVISGTTGWIDRYEAMVELCLKHNSSFLYASNFSLGVNLFFEVNRVLASLMTTRTEYKTHIEEIHHTQKVDAPSGTAISLANDIIERSRYTNWSVDAKGNDVLGISAQRIDNVPGTHHVTYTSEVDEIEIKHTAFSREGFALGAIIAAEWIQNKKGVFTMKDVLQINS